MLLGEADSGVIGGGATGEALRSKFESKINTEIIPRQATGGASQSVRNDLKRTEKSGEKVSRHTGRDDRATVEQVCLNHCKVLGGVIDRVGWFV